MSGMPPEPSPAPSLLSATIRAMAPAIPSATTLGEQDGPEDLYWLIDYLAFAVDAAQPAHPCRQGCFDCCRNQVFRVSEPEWERVRGGLSALPQASREAILARTHAMYGPHRPVLEKMATAWSAGERAEPAWHEAAPKACPVLAEDGRCSLYAERPAICRAYGAFSATVEGKTSVLICQQHGPGWIATLEAEGAADLTLPNWNPIQRRLLALAPGGMIKPLPLWLLDEPREPHPNEEAPCSA